MAVCDGLSHAATHGRQSTETTLTRFTLCEHVNNVNCICLAAFDCGSDDKHQLGKVSVVGCVAHLVYGRVFFLFWLRDHTVLAL